MTLTLLNVFRISPSAPVFLYQKTFVRNCYILSLFMLFIALSGCGESSSSPGDDVNLLGNDPPVAVDDLGYSTTILLPITIDVLANDFDPEGEALMLVNVTQPEVGTSEMWADGTVTYTPENPLTGLFSFSYTIRDSMGQEASANVTVEVNSEGPLEILSFTADPEFIAQGESSTLTWTSSGASSCELSPDNNIDGQVNGSLEITPTTSTEYTLTCQKSDEEEVEATVTVSILDEDTDEDGLNNGDEWTHGTDPTNPDTDGDLFLDGEEVAFGYDPLDRDMDDDGRYDSTEDWNMNGLLDENETDPNDPDSDDDNLCDGRRLNNDDDEEINPTDPCSGFEGIVYVDDESVGENDLFDGMNWQTAYNVLEGDSGAMDNTEPGVQVWVTEGVYTSTTDHNAVILVTSEVHIYGGFAGDEHLLSERPDPPLVSVLSGDIEGDDPENIEDNCNNIIWSYGRYDVVIDGFVLEGGNASFDIRLGAALYMELSEITMNNIVVQNNYAPANGGGFYVTNSELIISNSTFTNNVSDNVGGALYCVDSIINLENVDFIDNSSVLRSGGINLDMCTASYSGGLVQGNTSESGAGIRLTDSSELTIERVTVRDNHAVTQGGAFHIMESQMNADSIVVSSNSADNGGGFYLNRDSLLTLQAGQITDNTASASDGTGGGAMYASESTAYFNDVTMAGNNADMGSGGAIMCQDCVIDALHLSLSENSAGDDGSGGAIDISGGSLNLTLSTLDSNSAGTDGSISASEEAFIDISNSIFWDNSDGLSDDLDMALTYSCGEEGVDAFSDTNITIESSPFEYTASGERFLLRDISENPCLDWGNNGAAEAALESLLSFDDEWDTLTTSVTLEPDGDNDSDGADEVDAGRHYTTDRVFVLDLQSDESAVSWETVNADSCELFDDNINGVYQIPGGDLESGSVTFEELGSAPQGIRCQGERADSYSWLDT